MVGFPPIMGMSGAIPDGSSSSMWQVLELFKQISNDCEIFYDKGPDAHDHHEGVH